MTLATMLQVMLLEIGQRPRVPGGPLTTGGEQIETMNNTGSDIITVDR